MKGLIKILVIFICLLNCKPKELDIKKQDGCYIDLDTLVINKGNNIVRKLNLRGLAKHRIEDIKINYKSDSFRAYYFVWQNNNYNIVLDSCKHGVKKIFPTISINDKLIAKKIVYYSDSANYSFNNLLIDYSLSDFYANNENNHILIRSHVMSHTGKASNWNYYQLIDIKKLLVYEFYGHINNYNFLDSL